MLNLKKALRFILPYGAVRLHQDAYQRRIEEKQNADRKAREMQLFTANEIIYNGVRIFSHEQHPKITLTITGAGNSVVLPKFLGGGHLHITMRDNAQNCKIRVGENNTINNNLHIHFYNGGGRHPINSAVDIGNNNCFNGNVSIFGGLQPGTTIRIGNENLFADNIVLRGALDHLTYNTKTKEGYCKELGITIGDRVWICQEALFLNGGHIDSNAIVAARSIVNKKIKGSNILIAGAPAKVAKTDVMWHINTTDDYLSNASPLLI